ncbi:MAG: heavy metal-binding domain-containing protein [Verrucomicrobiota bacterium]|nr:heavy metal-binding domain-containing protein [Verrucomicrobiota bacterium]
MKTKSILTAMAALVLGITALSATGCDKSEPTTLTGNSAVQYTCPMHPEVVKDWSVNCPKCGMKLVEKK